MCNELNIKIRACLNDRLLKAEEDLPVKQVGLHTVCSGNVLVSADSIDLAQVDQTIVEWARVNGVNLVTVEYGDPAYTQYAYASVEDVIAVSGEQFDNLNAPKTVLYFKRIDNIKDKMVRRRLLDFMRTHLVMVGDGRVLAKNILFTIATIPNDMDIDEKRQLRFDAKDAFLFKIK